MTEGALRRSCKGPAVLLKSVSTSLGVPTKASVSLTKGSKSGKTVEDFLRAGHASRCLSVDLHRASCPGRSGPFYLSAPTCNQEDFTRRCFNPKYVWSIKTRRLEGLILKFTGHRESWMQLRSNEPTKSKRGLQLICDVF